MLSELTLKRFMIFNSSEGCKESQEQDKLLYHWTKDAPDNKVGLTEQIDDICLCDASVNISIKLNCDVSRQLPSANSSSSNSSTSSELNADLNGDLRNPEDESSLNGSFKPNENGKSLVLKFEKTLISIVEVEPRESIWMAVHVGSQSNNLDITNVSDSNQQPTFDPGCIPTDAIERLINNIYARFCLLNGTFRMIYEDELRCFTETNGGDIAKFKRDSIRERWRNVCEKYFSIVIPEIHLSSSISNITSLYNYVLYLDLNPITLMKVNSFINHITCIDAINIRHTIVIFNDQLLWSSLNMYDTRLLYNYLVSVLIRDALQEELSKEVEKVRKIKENLPIYITNLFNSQTELYNQSSTIINEIPLESQLTPTYVTSPTTEEDSKSFKERKLNRLFLTVFRSSNNLTLGLILNQPDLLDLIQKCEQVLTSDSRLGVIPLASLAQSVGQNFLRCNSSASSTPVSQAHHSASTLQATGSLHQSQSTSSANSNSLAWKASPNIHSNSATSSKGVLPIDQKYIYMDKLDVSISWPLNMDIQNNKEHILSAIDTSGSYTLDALQSMSKRQRLVRYLIEIEPELRSVKNQSGGLLVEEFIGKTYNDLWLTVTNSKYKTIYSIHNMRNWSLNEAQQSAISLKSILAKNRF